MRSRGAGKDASGSLVQQIKFTSIGNDIPIRFANGPWAHAGSAKLAGDF
jgi:hypothetical protein